jgi:hypothetical protein
MSDPLSDWVAARAEARRIVERIKLPFNLKGRMVGMPAFGCEKTCRHFYPERSLRFHEMVNMAFAWEVRERNGVVRQSVHAVTGDESSCGPPEGRRRAVERSYGLIPIPGAVTMYGASPVEEETPP